MNIQYKNKLRCYLYPTPLISWNMSLTPGGIEAREKQSEPNLGLAVYFIKSAIGRERVDGSHSV